MSTSPVRRSRAAAGMWTANMLSVPAGVLSMVRSIWRLRGWDRAQSFRTSFPDCRNVPVIFCTWKRLERLPLTLQMLAAQDVPVQALIWDNSGQAEIVDKAVSDSLIPVAVHHSSHNIGGFGRFYLAQAAAEAGHEAVVFVDDDQDFEPEAIRELFSAHRPKSISGTWAFHFTGKHYYTRERCASGAAAHYLGTGGMVTDSTIFNDPRLFACPRRFWFAEDLWLCFVAQHLNGYALTSNSTKVTEVPAGRRQWVKLWWVKDRLRLYTGRRGWLRPSD